MLSELHRHINLSDSSIESDLELNRVHAISYLLLQAAFSATSATIVLMIVLKMISGCIPNEYFSSSHFQKVALLHPAVEKCLPQEVILCTQLPVCFQVLAHRSLKLTSDFTAGFSFLPSNSTSSSWASDTSAQIVGAPATHPSNTTAPIITGVVGGVAFFVCIAVLVWYLLKRRQANKRRKVG